MSEYNLSVLELVEGREYESNHDGCRTSVYKIFDGELKFESFDHWQISTTPLGANKKIFKEIIPKQKTKEVWQWVSIQHKDGYPYISPYPITEKAAADEFKDYVHYSKTEGPFTVPDYSEDV